MARALRVQAPGLRWQRRPEGRMPVWCAEPDAIAAGFRPVRVTLGHLAARPELLKARCAALSADLRLWQAGHRFEAEPFDGSIRSLVAIYLHHKKSPFHKLRPGTSRTYGSCARRLSALAGDRQIDSVSGLDLSDWHDDWSGGGRHLPAAAGLRNVLLASGVFGVMLRLSGCRDLVAVIRETRRVFKRNPPRVSVLSAAEVATVRQAAHAAGHPERALAYALVYETTLRLFDVIGQWWPADRGPASSVMDGDGKKWFGLDWSEIDDRLVLRRTPSKTAETSGVSIVYPLHRAPMVMEELKRVPLKRRAGPLIVDPRTGLPPKRSSFRDGWAADRKAAGLPVTAWARDLRASGITEGRAGGATLDDAGKIAGHAGIKTTARVYDRAALEAAERFAAARAKVRKRRR